MGIFYSFLLCWEYIEDVERDLDFPDANSDVDVDKPDEKSIMTYVAQFLKSYPDPSAKGDKVKILSRNSNFQKSMFF